MIPSTLLSALETQHFDLIESQVKFIDDIAKLQSGPKQDPLLTYVAKTDKKIYECIRNKIHSLGGKIADFINQPSRVEISEKGQYPLHIAASYGCADLLGALVADGADVNQLSEPANNKNGRTPLQIAAERKSLICFMRLLEMKADWNKPDSRGGPLYNYFDDVFFNKMKREIEAVVKVTIMETVLGSVSHSDVSYFSLSASGSNERPLNDQERETLLKKASNPSFSGKGIDALCSHYVKDYQQHMDKKKAEEALLTANVVEAPVDESITTIERLFYKNVDTGNEKAALAFINQQKKPPVLNRLLAYVKGKETFENAIQQRIDALTMQ